MALSSSGLTALSDEALLERLRELLARDAGLEADLLAHIGEVDARELYLPLGYPSLYAYLTEGLHLSESAATTASRRRAQHARFRLSSTACVQESCTSRGFVCSHRS